jgi:calcium homeostasis endoplasmic reticulum protein
MVVTGDFPITDQDLRNIIDKLAQFVARNGHEFENMTKNKQKENPKFAFLHGGEYFNYYQYKVTTEQASKLIQKILMVARHIN